jgi:hypothetical protein
LIYVVQDNWSIRHHAEVEAALSDLPQIEPVWLPTYAPWLNPIEKPGTLWVPLAAGTRAERQAIAAGVLGVTTWQQVCAAFQIDYVALTDT